MDDEDKRELWVVEEVAADASWYPLDEYAWTDPLGAAAALSFPGVRLSRYVPEDAVTRGQIAILETALRAIRDRRKSCLDARSDLAPGLALAGVELERQIEALSYQALRYPSPDAGGKGGPNA